MWFYTHQSHDALTLPGKDPRRATPDDLTLALAVPKLTPTLFEELALLGLTLECQDDGYHRARGFCAVAVIELSAVAAHEHDELMAWFAGTQRHPSMELTRWIGQNTSAMTTPDKASPEMEGFADWFIALRDGLPLELRLAGLAPEERLAGLDPEDLARVLSEADRVLALPDAALRGLPADYLATLPEAAQQRVRARLGR